jgi:hypothetical protein
VLPPRPKVSNILAEKRKGIEKLEKPRCSTVSRPCYPRDRRSPTFLQRSERVSKNSKNPVVARSPDRATPATEGLQHSCREAKGYRKTRKTPVVARSPDRATPPTEGLQHTCREAKGYRKTRKTPPSYRSRYCLALRSENDRGHRGREKGITENCPTRALWKNTTVRNSVARASSP